MQYSRRQFLQASGALGAAAPVPSFAANDRVNVGVIGTGARSHELMQALMMVPAAEIVGVADAYQGRVQRAIERVGKKAKPFPSFRDLLADQAIDLPIKQSTPL